MPQQQYRNPPQSILHKLGAQGAVILLFNLGKKLDRIGKAMEKQTQLLESIESASTYQMRIKKKEKADEDTIKPLSFR